MSPKAESAKVESRWSLSPLCHGTCQSGQAEKARRRDGGTHVNLERGTGAASLFSSRVVMGICVSVRQVVGRGHFVLKTIGGDMGQPGFLSAPFRCHAVSSSLVIQTVLGSVLRWLVRRTGQSSRLPRAMHRVWCHGSLADLFTARTVRDDQVAYQGVEVDAMAPMFQGDQESLV